MLKVSPATTSSTCCFAHSLTGRPCGEWEPLAKHAVAVGDLASEFAKVFGWDGMACAAGRLHDAGKASAEFQAYIQGNGGSVDHSTKGARVANTLYQGLPGRILALCIAGHHAGLLGETFALMLGNPRLRAGTTDSAKAAAAASASQARKWAADILPLIWQAQKAGATTLQAVANAMIARGIPTPGGRGRWHPATVKRVMGYGA